MDVKKYRFASVEREKVVYISRDIHYGLRIIAKEMDCTIQEVAYRLLLRGMQWYLLKVKPKVGAERDAEWALNPGANPIPARRVKRYQGPRRYSKLPPINTQQQPPENTPPKETTTIPDDYFPGDL
jgi:hypothetical protein